MYVTLILSCKVLPNFAIDHFNYKCTSAQLWKRSMRENVPLAERIQRGGGEEVVNDTELDWRVKNNWYILIDFLYIQKYISTNFEKWIRCRLPGAAAASPLSLFAMLQPTEWKFSQIRVQLGHSTFCTNMKKKKKKKKDTFNTNTVTKIKAPQHVDNSSCAEWLTSSIVRLCSKSAASYSRAPSEPTKARTNADTASRNLGE